MSAANLVEAACELHALLQRRSAAGLGPLVGADGSLGTPDDPAVHPCPGKGESRNPAIAMQHMSSHDLLGSVTWAVFKLAILCRNSFRTKPLFAT